MESVKDERERKRKKGKDEREIEMVNERRER
jgi:hypothetical protein